MSCCGQKREALRTKRSTDKVETSERETVHGNNQPYTVFRYEGQAAATFTGAVTGKSYRFNFKGDTRIVDSRDAAAMLGEPFLQCTT